MIDNREELNYDDFSDLEFIEFELEVIEQDKQPLTNAMYLMIAHEM
jgi:hypothetical protein